MPIGRIPRWVKLAYTAFVAVLVPSYWRTYGPANFLQFCDVAAGVTLVGLWIESSLLISVEAVAVLVPQTVWVIDFGARLFGLRGLGMTGYMFDPRYPRWVRSLSLFHGWLPFLLLWGLRRLGYDRRAFGIQTVLGVGLLLLCYLAFDPPGTVGGKRHAANVNYVFGISGKHPQKAMPPRAWLAMTIAVAVLGMFLPAHLLLRRTMPPARPPRRFARA
jgi:hypothetical protein